MIVPIIFQDINFNIYKISTDCRIFVNDEEIKIDDIIYHSTNGYDYVLLETLTGNKKLYRLEFIMISSFHVGIQSKWPHFKVGHLDGDILNCHIDNLYYEEDKEIWVDLIYPGVKKGMYKVSNFGNFYSYNDNKIMRLRRHPSGYIYIDLERYDKTSSLRAHRIIAKHFTINPNPDKFDIVNHIDGDGCNNHISNLEWVNLKMNSRHAILTGNIGSNKLSSDEVDMIINLLRRPGISGSVMSAYNKIHIEYPNITLYDIKCIKSKNPSYLIKSRIPNVEDINFINCIKSRITDDEVDMVIGKLLDEKYGYSPTKVFESIDHNIHPLITRNVVNHIKSKSPQYIRDASKYDLTNIKFKTCRQ